MAAVPVFTDDFNDNALNRVFWVPSVAGSGPTIAEVNQRLEVTLPSNSAGTTFVGEYTSRCTIRGDFDMAVDYALLAWPSANGVRVGLGVKPAPVSASQPIERISDRREYYLTHFGDGVQGVIRTSDSSGKLRLVRNAGMLTGYVLGSTGWIPLHSGPGLNDEVYVGLAAWSHDSIFAHMETKVAFDNFVVSQGELVCPVDRLMQAVQSRVSAGLLKQGLGNSLAVKLEAAKASLAQFSTQTASNQLGAFVNEMTALTRSGRLPQLAGQPLIDAANTEINWLTGS